MKPQQNAGAVLGLLLSACVISACDRAPDVLALAAPSAVSQSVSAVTGNDVFQLNFTLFNPCTGENVHWQGPLHVVMRSQSDGSGGYTVGWTQNMRNVVGTGQITGNTYHLVGVYSNQEHVRPPFPATINREFRRRWISQGSSPDAYVYGSYRLTVDANGGARLDDWQPWSIFAPDCR
jgi:hypothetical protein